MGYVSSYLISLYMGKWKNGEYFTPRYKCRYEYVFHFSSDSDQSKIIVGWLARMAKHLIGKYASLFNFVVRRKKARMGHSERQTTAHTVPTNTTSATSLLYLELSETSTCLHSESSALDFDKKFCESWVRRFNERMRQRTEETCVIVPRSKISSTCQHNK
jgi:hypothetical protein